MKLSDCRLFRVVNSRLSWNYLLLFSRKATFIWSSLTANLRQPPSDSPNTTLFYHSSYQHPLFLTHSFAAFFSPFPWSSRLLVPLEHPEHVDTCVFFSFGLFCHTRNTFCSWGLISRELHKYRDLQIVYCACAQFGEVSLIWALNDKAFTGKGSAY